MIHCSQLFNVSKYGHRSVIRSGSSILANLLNIYHSDHFKSTSLVESLQKVMSELVKRSPGVKPEVPLRMDSEDGVPTWLMEAWLFDGFQIIAVSKHRQGSPKGDIETRLEFVPINM